MQDTINARPLLIVAFVISCDSWPNFGFFQIVMSFVVENQQHPVQIVISFSYFVV